MRRFSVTLLCFLSISLSLAAATPKKDEKAAEKKAEKPAAKSPTDAKAPDASDAWSGLEFRSIGPAVTGRTRRRHRGRSRDSQRRFVAVASGGVWRTDNDGTTWTPTFDDEGSYSIGCVAIDPKNPSVVWVGTGENNSQRSVSYGDGVYRSEDSGKSWKNMGLKSSEHISEDPDRSAQLERRLCRGAGPALVLRRRAGPLQDDRRRKVLEGRPDDQREHRCDRRRHRSARPGRPLRLVLPAASGTSGR